MSPFSTLPHRLQVSPSRSGPSQTRGVQEVLPGEFSAPHPLCLPYPVGQNLSPVPKLLPHLPLKKQDHACHRAPCPRQWGLLALRLMSLGYPQAMELIKKSFFFFWHSKVRISSANKIWKGKRCLVVNVFAASDLTEKRLLLTGALAS